MQAAHLRGGAMTREDMRPGLGPGDSKRGEVFDEELRRLKEQGMTYNDIAKELGVSKGVVIGRANRLGLLGHEPKRAFAVLERPQDAPPIREPDAVPEAPAPPEERPPDPEPLRATAKRLPRGEGCAYIAGPAPFSDASFCGQPRRRGAEGPNSPYCADHHTRCYIGKKAGTSLTMRRSLSALRLLPRRRDQ